MIYIFHFIQSFYIYWKLTPKERTFLTRQKLVCKYCTQHKLDCTFGSKLYVCCLHIIASRNINWNFLYILNELNDLYFCFHTIILHWCNNFTFYAKLTPKQTTLLTQQKHFESIVYNTNTNVHCTVNLESVFWSVFKRILFVWHKT